MIKTNKLKNPIKIRLEEMEMSIATFAIAMCVSYGTAHMWISGLNKVPAKRFERMKLALEYPEIQKEYEIWRKGFENADLL